MAWRICSFFKMVEVELIMARRQVIGLSSTPLAIRISFDNVVKGNVVKGAV